MNEEHNNAPVRDLWERTKMLYISMLPSPEEKSQIERYFSMICGVDRLGDVVIISTTNAKVAEILEKEHASKIRTFLGVMSGDSNLQIEFRCDESVKQEIIIPVRDEGTLQEGASRRLHEFKSTMPLKEEYTFAEFVEGPSNGWAYASAKGVVAHPGAKDYNPLFIHGGTGLGKTHLMQAIGNELKARNPNLAVCYLTAEAFLNEYVNAVQNTAVASFRTRYRNIDVLLVDDVQFLQRGKNMQEEFFNTFNYLQDMHKQVVMTSDVAPQNLPALEERLISRFIGGMVQEIESPSYETRLAILKKKTEHTTPRIPLSVLEFIANNIKSHVRAMEGALAKVKVIYSYNPTAEISPMMLSHLLKDFIDNDQTLRKMTISEIQDAVARRFKVTREAILSSERTQMMVTPRHMAMYIARKYTSKSLEEIGRAFNKKHSAILNGVKQTQDRINTDTSIKQILEQILAEFGVSPNAQDGDINQ